jgi:serine/threonine-protein kinase
MGDARAGLVLEDRYRIASRVASGGTGVVYRANHVGQARDVAVKFLHQSAADSATHRSRFRREAEAMSRVTHPNLCSIVGFGLHAGQSYLVMELVEGMSVRKVLEAGPLELTRAVNITRQILAGLGSAHDAGVVHRDLKPGNIILAISVSDDHVKILDFGVAKLLGDGHRTELSVVTQSPIGTPQYMSPEQARGSEIDPRTDLYAVGVLLYEMATGKRPFDGGAGFAVLRMQVEDDPVPPRQLVPAMSAALEAVILKAMSKEPADRFASAADMSAALALVPELDVPAAKEPESTGKIRRRGERRGRGVLVALLVTLAAVLVGTWQAAERELIELPAWSPWQPAIASIEVALPVDAAPPPIDAQPAPPPWTPEPANVELAVDPARPEVDTTKLRGEIGGEPFEPLHASLSVTGDVAVLRFDAAAPVDGADLCEARQAGTPALELSLPAAALIEGERISGVAGAELRVATVEAPEPIDGRWRLELERLDAAESTVAGTIQIRGDARLDGSFAAVYCGDPRALAGEPPRVNGARWDPDRAPLPDDLPAAEVAGALGTAELRIAHATLNEASDPDRLVLSMFADEPADRCAELRGKERGVSVVIPADLIDESYALSSVLDPAPGALPWVGLQPGGAHTIRADIVALRIDAMSAIDVRGRIYAAAADRRRSLVAGAFRAVDCRR